MTTTKTQERGKHVRGKRGQEGEEIASRMGLTAGNLYVIRHRAIKLLASFDAVNRSGFGRHCDLPRGWSHGCTEEVSGGAA